MHRHLYAAALAIGLALPGSAFAEPRDPAAAEALFTKAREQMSHREYAAACPMLVESQRLDPAAGTLLNLADCEEHIGDLASAWAHWREAIDQLAANDDALPVAKQRLAALDARVPRLTIRLAPSAPAGARVKRDGVELASLSLGVALVVNPGKHEIVVSAPGRQAQREAVVLGEGERKEITALVGAEVVAAGPVRERSEVSFWEQHRASFVVGAGALALAGAGAAVAAKILPDHAAFAKTCSSRVCTDEDRAPLRREMVATNVLFAAAGVAAVTAAVLGLTVERPKKGPSVSVVPTGAGGAVIVRY